MRSTLRITAHLLSISMLPMLSQVSWSQCNNGTPFGTINAPTTNVITTITTCAFAGEYSTINNCTAGSTYNFNSTGGNGNYLTIRQGTPGGAVLGFGFAPVSVVCTANGPLYLHYNTNAACGTESACRTGTVQCTSCPGAGDPCSNITNLLCATSTTATLTGAGSWNTTACGFSTPGAERIYAFTPTSTGVHQLQVTSTNSGGYIDYFIKNASGGCNSAGWTCILDIFSPTTVSLGTLTAGTTYYLLLDPETTASVTHTFQINCPASFDPCASVPNILCATSTTATISGTGVWSPNSCGFSTPGQERVYTFTPTTTGVHQLQVTSTNSGGYIDYFYKVASGGCNATGWTCILDIFSPTTVSMGTLTAGTTYYILLDPETTALVTHTFQINCPSGGGTPPCVPSPSSPTNGQANICPSATHTLTWPASVGATSYDVYFGTSATPPFVGNTAATSYVATTPTASVYFWQIRPRNANGPATGCNIWSFSKIDVTPPTITCSPNIEVNNNPATACSAVVTYSISGSDNCSAPTLSQLSGLASGSAFPVGTTTNVWRAMDASGLTSTCAFTVKVNDITLPNITCPANIVRNNDPGLCAAAVAYNTPAATDNCAIASVTLISGLASGALHPVGLTTNVWRATDVNNNTRTCSFTVTVLDVEKPVAICPPNRSVNTDPGKCSANISILGGLQVFDNCALTGTTNDAPAPFPIGETVVTWTATDVSGNSGTCSFLVTVTDLEPPSVSCPGNINTLTDEGDCAATVNFTVLSSDNCGVVSSDLSESSGYAFPIGYTYVTYSASDAHGNYSSCSFLVRVNTRPEICNGFDDDCDGWVDEAEDWTALAKRLASDGASADQYGLSVDIDGDFAIVGSNKKDAQGQSVGAAYILFRDKGGANKWGQVVNLGTPDLLPGDYFGASVAISGSIAAVGAPFDDVQFGNQGSVSIFYQNPNNPEQWDFVKKIVASDANAADNFGASVALDGNRLVVGSPLNDQSGNNAGAAYIFYRNEGGNDEWGQVRKLLATTASADDEMGQAVAIDGDHVIVGAPGVDGLFQNAGAAYIFGRNHTGPDAWGQVARISTNQSGQNDNFGAAVGISGAWAIVGADRNDIKGADAGVAFLFHQNHLGIQNSWGQRQMLLDFAGAAGKRFGSAVGIDEPYAVVAAKGDSPFGAGSGRGFVYLLDGGTWLPVDQLADGGGQAGDALGSSAAISGRNIILGAPLDDVGQKADQGSVTIYGGLCDSDLHQDGGEERDESSRLAAAETLHCYPVPFSGVLNIEIRGLNASFAQLTIVNALGQEVANLFKGAVEGDMLVQWQTGQIADGLYFLRLATNEQVITRPIVRSH